MILRNASEHDAPQFVTLLAQMGYIMNLENMKARIVAFQSNNHQIIVAEQENLVIGLIAFGCYEHFRLEGSCCHIDTLVIDKSYRGQGIGRQLLEAAEKYASDRGAKTIELITANHRRSDGTHAFYESSGYKDHNALDYSYFAKEML